jgi:SAM-dependent methyltransferase
MGILKPHIELLCREKVKHEDFFCGDLLTLGQQAVYATQEEVLKILKRNHLKPQELPKNFDTKNKIPDWRNTPYDKNINAQTLFKLLGADNTLVADVSSYENPDFILDLNNLIEEPSLLGRFDTIVDVGTIEHVFDVNCALSNIVNMLKVGGRVMIIVPASNAIDHGFYSYSPTLFFDYFSENGFSDFSCYLRESSFLVHEKKSKLYEYMNVGLELPITSKSTIEVAFCAKKIESIYPLKKPFQRVYKTQERWFNNSLVEPVASFNKNSTSIKATGFSQTFKFYGGNYFPFILEIIQKIKVAVKNRNIR